MSVFETVKTDRCPVDFDHASPSHAKSWPTESKALREKCPVLWSEHHGGFWAALGYNDVVKMAKDATTFTNGKTFDPETRVVTGGVTIPPLPVPPSIPDETDNPEWAKFRKFLNRRFGPPAVEARRANAQRYATLLIDNVIERGKIDLVDDFTSPLPAISTMEIFGFPLREWRRFADPLHKLMFTPEGSPNRAAAVKGIEWIATRVLDEVADRRKHPRDDFITQLATGTIDGEPLTDEVINGIAMNFLVGAVDTTTAVAAHAFLHLFHNPADKRRLIEDPDLLQLAREEFVRFVSPVHGTARTVSAETVAHGQKMMPGERLYLAWSTANRDPEIFDNPDKVVIDRYPNRHIGYGTGMHRCIGSFQAKMMIEVMLGEILRRIPEYVVIEEPAERYESIWAIDGWVSMPATFPPGKRSLPIDAADELALNVEA